MQAVEIHVPPPEFPETLNAMREWLDQRRLSTKQFRSARDAHNGVVIVRAEFDDAETAAAFRDQFSYPLKP